MGKVYPYKVEITVLEKIGVSDLYEQYANREKTQTVCLRQTIGKKFISQNAEKPKQFCNRAWVAFRDKVRSLALGNDSPSINQSGIEIVCCPDGLHPVIYKLERMKE